MLICSNELASWIKKTIFADSKNYEFIIKENSMNFKKWNNIIGWLAGAVAAIVYFATMESTVSWWDCGEYISTAYKLQVGHPPGAPLFQMIGRFFSLFAFGDVTKVALMINIMSALCSALTITFLFWTITMLARKIWMKEEENASMTRKIGVLVAAFVGAIAYTFTESFWFSAVEGEVYAMSSFFTAVTFWAILKWERVADDPKSYRWILLIAYLIGLSIGVHLLNLLCIPAIAFVIYYKKTAKPSFWGFFLTGVISVVVLGFIQVILIPLIVSMAGSFELFFVNNLHAPFNLGTIVYFILLTGFVIAFIWLSTVYKKVILNTIALSLMFILIGYSSFFMLAIRANTNTPINENEPSDAVSMLSYLKREQYGSWPLLYGQYYNSPPIAYEGGSPTYVKDEVNKKYIITDSGRSSKVKYAEGTETLFPRMWSNQRQAHRSIYEEYMKDKNGRVKGKNVRVTLANGETQTITQPTFGQNLRFFFGYQVNHMYWRYFLWNFVGRQNDIESQGELEHGNWISGISFIDNARLGTQDNLPSLMSNPARTRFYFLPLILGLIGLFWHLRHDKKDTWIVFMLFFMTGLAIVIYLNQTPLQPRERDYAYAGSFYAFAIWIGMGVLAIIEMLNKALKKESMITMGLVGLMCFLAVPCLMGAEGWEGHNRNGKTSALDWARNYLSQLPPNSVIFTRGDNDTFPLWYIQEVEGFRTDVRVVNYMLSSGYWYVHQMGRKVYNSEALPLTLSPSDYDNGINEVIPVVEKNESIKNTRHELIELIRFVQSKNKSTTLTYHDGSTTKYIPARKVKLIVDKEKAIKNGIVPTSMADRVVDVIEWDIQENYIYKNALMLLDFMASNDWERPVYFTSFSDMSKVLGIDKYLHMEGLAYRFIPVEADNYYKGLGGVYTEGSYDLLVNNARWGNLNSPDVVPDRESVRNTEFAKQSYARLAQALISNQQYDSATIVLDKFQEFFPNTKFPYDLRVYSFPTMYYACQAYEKGDTMLMDIVNNYYDKILYIMGQKEGIIDYYYEDLEEAFNVISHMGKVSKDYNRPDITKNIEEKLNGISGLYR